MLPILNAVVPPYRHSVRNKAVRAGACDRVPERENMRTIKSLSRLGVVLGSLAVIAVSFAAVLVERTRVARRRPVRPVA